MFLGEFGVGVDGVFGDTQDNDVVGLVLLVGITKGTGFFGATGCVVFGVEIEHDPLATVAFEATLCAVLVREGEVGSFGVWLEHYEYYTALITTGSVLAAMVGE